MVLFGTPIIIRHLMFGYSGRDHNFDNHPYRVAHKTLNQVRFIEAKMEATM